MSAWIRDLRSSGSPRAPEAPDSARRATERLGPEPVAWAVEAAAAVLTKLSAEHAAGSIALTGREPAAIEASMVSLLEVLADGGPISAPVEAVQQVRWAAREGHTLATLLRVVWLTHAQVQSYVIDALTAAVPSDELAAELRRVARVLLDFVATLVQELTAVYDEASADWDPYRSAAVRRTLDQIAATGSAPTGAEATLGLRLTGHHLAGVIWPVGQEADPTWNPETATWIESVSRLLGSGRALIIPRTDGSIEALWTARTPLSTALVEPAHLAPPPDSAAALGVSASGTEGLRQTILAARRVAAAGRLVAERRLWTYREHAVVAMLMAEPEAGREFVRHELSGLAGVDERSAELRSTLLAFLESGGSRTAAADALHIAPTTVAYRVTNALKRLAEPIERRRFSLVVALRLVADFPALLQPPAP